jgi:cystathionine beta-lyase
MTYSFDEVIERRGSDSIKWQYYGPNVLPLWVADMDFRSPDAVTQAIQARAAEGIFGYPYDSPELREVIVERLGRLYGWHITPEDVLFVPGVVAGFNLMMRALCEPGEGVLVQTPVYPHMLSAPANNLLQRHEMELTRRADGRYVVDLAAFEAAMTPETRMFLLCNPHNPTGRAFTRTELGAMAEVCLRHEVLICSDEIHCDLLYPGVSHTPVATLAPEVAQRTVTLIAPSKTFNVPGLGCSIAIVTDPGLRRRIEARRHDTVGGVNAFGFAGALAAYRDGGPWLDALLRYLAANRDFVAAFVAEHLPGIHMSPMEATYLAWLDCRDAGLGDSPFKFFIGEAKVALNDGQTFGQGGRGCVRLNFGCPRATLEQALGQMRQALEAARRPA